jgi:hypothetical protein
MVNRKKNIPAVELTVIIVNYNVREFLAHAIHSLKRSLGKIAAQIIVVDNASTDGSVEMLKKRFRSIDLVALKQNLGFAKANNIGLQRARGELVLLLNPDTLVQEDTIPVMIDFFLQHPRVGLAGCKVINPDGSFQASCRRSFPDPWSAFSKISGLSTLFPHSRSFGKYNLTYLDPDTDGEIDAVSGSFMMFRREVYERIGGLDEDFFMYGEDLDFCFRAQQAGWTIYYCPKTTIIHYKGESTRRSTINEVKTFYEAMHLFVEKHFKRSFLLKLFLRLSIFITSKLAAFKRVFLPLRAAVLDILFVNAALAIGYLVWLSDHYRFPDYGYPIVYTIPALVTVVCLYVLGVYTHHRVSLVRTASGVLVSFMLLSALLAFFKQYAFSRMLIIIAGAISALLLPAWRFFLGRLLRYNTAGSNELFFRRTMIVGTGKKAIDLMHRLEARIDKHYRVIAFVDPTNRNVGNAVENIPIAGNLDTIGKLIDTMRITDVIFPAQGLSYMEILKVISRCKKYPINFFIVPSSYEVIIGNATIDSVDGIPLVELSYNIDLPLNRFFKRITDISLSLFLLLLVFPFVRLRRMIYGSTRSRFIRFLPEVLFGRKSLVGHCSDSSESVQHGISIGKPGLTGIVQLLGKNDLSEKEIEQYYLYYAKNQSTSLDLEILLRTLFQRRWIASRNHIDILSSHKY